VGGLSGLFFAVLFGYVTTKKAGTTFAMITLGVGELVFAMSLMFPEFFGGEGGITTNRAYGKPVFGISFGPQIQVYYLIAVYCFVCTAAMFAFTRTPLGRILNAVRDNPERVEFIGYNTQRVRYYAFIIAGFFAGIGGGLAAINFGDRHRRSRERRALRQPAAVHLPGRCDLLLRPHHRRRPAGAGADPAVGTLHGLAALCGPDLPVHGDVCAGRHRQPDHDEPARGLLRQAQGIVGGLPGPGRHGASPRWPARRPWWRWCTTCSSIRPWAPSSALWACGSTPPTSTAGWARVLCWSPAWACLNSRAVNSSRNGARSRMTLKKRSSGGNCYERDSLFELKDLRKSFGKTEIIRGTNLQVQAGERVAIIGPNGAGKSTLFNLISGRFEPTSGQVLLNGQRIDGKKPFEINRLGLSRSFQITNIFPKLSVFENLRCGVLWSLGYKYTFFRFLADLDDANERAEQLMAMIKLDKKRDVLATNLTYAEQRALEIGITIAGGANVILLDEPTAGMSRSETSRFINLIKEVTVGKTLLTVEHDMGVVFGLADKIAVVVYGEIIAYDTPEAVRADQRVQEAYLGSSVADAQAGGH
jgi:branched-chain amino acid transport system ATP-binding protein